MVVVTRKLPTKRVGQANLITKGSDVLLHTGYNLYMYRQC